MFNRMSLGEIVGRIDRRLKALGMSASEAERRAGKRDAIRNLRRAVKSGRQGVSTRTLTALAPALTTTVEWLTTGVGQEQADELPELARGLRLRSGDRAAVDRPADSLNPVTDADLIVYFGLAFHELIDVPEAEATVLARAVVRAIRTPNASPEQRRAWVATAVDLFRHR